MQTTLADLEEIRQLCSISVARPISKQDMQVDVAPFIDTYEKRRFKRRRQESTTAAEDSQVVEKESDSLGLLAMLRAMAAAGGLKQQMAAMDVFKLQLRVRLRLTAKPDPVNVVRSLISGLVPGVCLG